MWLGLLVFALIVFFLPLFLPHLQLIITPDFGRSDAWEFSFATKFLLGEALRSGSLPTWTPLLGGGFPLIGEGQIGAFFAPNLILFGLFPAALAYNLTIVLAVVTAGWGMFVLLRRFGIFAAGAWLGAISLALSGIIIPQLTHHALIQGISLLPWALIATDLLIEKNSPRRIAVWALIVSQQIFAGFPQAVFVTVLCCALYTAWHKKPFALLLPGILALALAAVQLFPSYEFLQQSPVAGGFSPSESMYFSFPPVHLLTLFAPFALGNPKLGTYPPFSTFDGSIFWENTGFFGTIGILLSGIGSFLALKHRSNLRFFIASAATGLLLMMGKYSPLYIIFTLWPFSLFRVPSRFIWIFVLSLIVLASYAADRIAKTKLPYARHAVVLLIFFHTLQLGFLWHSYHALWSASDWLSPPPVTASIPPGQRVYTLGANIPHNEAFLSQGWQDSTAYYTVRNSLAPDGNVLWGIPAADVYAGRQLTRQGIMSALVSGEITPGPSEASISATGKQFLRILGTGQLITPRSGGEIEISPVADTAPRIYMATDIRYASTVSEAVAALKQPSFTPGQSVLVENEAARLTSAGGTATLHEESSTYLHIEAEATDAALLVVTDTYYPGWTATIDGRETPILAANISQRAVVLPAGTHDVVFRYAPKSLVWGGALSVAALMFTVFLAVSPHARVRRYNAQTDPARAPHRRRNPYTSRTRTK